jgi:tetraacyldisaccharide 4'-kinase
MGSLHKRIDGFGRRIKTIAGSSDPAPLFSIDSLLWVFSCLYSYLMTVRARLYISGILHSKELPCRVVSIGNIVAGGTGKTPMTIWVAQAIRNQGRRVVVLSRGYGGRMENGGGVVSDGLAILKGPEDAGDEPYLMASLLDGIPVVVGSNRYDMGRMAMERFTPDVIVLDDAFQHIRLMRDLNIVLLDSRSPVGNGHVLPRGLLREPVSALKRADIVVYTRCPPDGQPTATADMPLRQAAFRTTHTPVIRKIGAGNGSIFNGEKDISVLSSKRVMAFAGLAENTQFFDQLQQAGCVVCRAVAFADHHQYTPKDLEQIAAIANAERVDAVVTTSKDFVKVQTYDDWPAEMVVVDVAIKMLENEELFKSILVGV